MNNYTHYLKDQLYQLALIVVAYCAGYQGALLFNSNPGVLPDVMFIVLFSITYLLFGAYMKYKDQ